MRDTIKSEFEFEVFNEVEFRFLSFLRFNCENGAEDLAITLFLLRSNRAQDRKVSEG